MITINVVIGKNFLNYKKYFSGKQPVKLIEPTKTI